MTHNQQPKESIIYQVNNHNCELIFTLCSNSENKYPLYDLHFKIDNFNEIELWEQIRGESPTNFNIWDIKSILTTSVKYLDQWCNEHPETFLSFFDCLLSNYLLRFYFKLGFICDGRVDTFVTFINHERKRTAYIGMLNLLTQEDFYVNEIWRVAKDTHYYLGDIYTPIDLITDALSESKFKDKIIIKGYKKPSFFDT